jgi:hypothetical protein
MFIGGFRKDPRTSCRKESKVKEEIQFLVTRCWGFSGGLWTLKDILNEVIRGRTPLIEVIADLVEYNDVLCCGLVLGSNDSQGLPRLHPATDIK